MFKVVLMLMILIAGLGCVKERLTPGTSMAIPGGLSRPPAHKVGTSEWMEGKVWLIDPQTGWLTIETMTGRPVTLQVTSGGSPILDIVRKGDTVRVMVEWRETGGYVTIWDFKKTLDP